MLRRPRRSEVCRSLRNLPWALIRALGTIVIVVTNGATAAREAEDDERAEREERRRRRRERHERHRRERHRREDREDEGDYDHEHRRRRREKDSHSESETSEDERKGGSRESTSLREDAERTGGYNNYLRNPTRRGE